MREQSWNMEKRDITSIYNERAIDVKEYTVGSIKKLYSTWVLVYDRRPGAQHLLKSKRKRASDQSKIDSFCPI